MLALTYGTGVDWYRNMMAAEHSTLLWRGRQYTLARPEGVDAQTGLAAFLRPQRFILRRFGVQDFALVRVLSGTRS